jgi:hypothetical protein
MVTLTAARERPTEANVALINEPDAALARSIC